MDQFTHRTHAPIAQMVDIIGLEAWVVIVQQNNPLNDFENVAVKQYPDVEAGRVGDTVALVEVFVEFVATHFGQIVTPFAEEI